MMSDFLPLCDVQLQPRGQHRKTQTVAEVSVKPEHAALSDAADYMPGHIVLARPDSVLKTQRDHGTALLVLRNG
jgi:hypothetical protein